MSEVQWVPDYPDIKPCPFCNCTGEIIRPYGEIRVACNVCKALGPVVPIKVEEATTGKELVQAEVKAIIAWNERGVVKNV